MKTLRTILIIATVIFASCSDKDDAPVPAEPVGPQLSYAETSFSTTFHEEGSSDIPTLKWNGEIGNLSLSNSIPGIYLNNANGVLSWKGALPLGINTVTVVATNSIGQKTVTMEIENKFQGDFSGGMNSDPNSEVLTMTDHKLKFSADGTFTAITVGHYGEGNWTREGNTITAVSSYNGGANIITFKMELKYSNSKAELEGYWYEGNQAIEANIKGYTLIKL